MAGGLWILMPQLSEHWDYRCKLLLIALSSILDTSQTIRWIILEFHGGILFLGFIYLEHS